MQPFSYRADGFADVPRSEAASTEHGRARDGHTSLPVNRGSPQRVGETASHEDNTRMVEAQENDDLPEGQRFLDAVLADVERGAIQPIEHYLRLFPKAEEQIRAQYPYLIVADPRSERDRVINGVELIHPEIPRPGSDFGSYFIEQVIGKGGQGDVYRARHRDLNRLVALKIFLPRTVAEYRTFARFRREACLLAEIDDPGVCTIYESGIVNGCPFIAMRLLDGQTLASMVRDAKASDAPIRTGAEETARIDAVARIICGVARAMRSCHALGIVHRDIKPSNIMVEKSGRAVVIDFGLAKNLLEEAEGGLTLSVDQLGTPIYMAPEQMVRRGPKIDHRTDIFALGLSLYEAVTLEIPFDGQRTVGMPTIHRHPELRRADSRNRRCPGAIANVIAKAAAVDPSERFQSMDEFSRHLEAALGDGDLETKTASVWIRTKRWVRRNPAPALSMAIIFTILTVALSVTLAALARAKEALAESRWKAYVANVTGAASMIAQGNFGAAKGRLAECPDEHRNFEWRMALSEASPAVDQWDVGIDPNSSTTIAVAGRVVLSHDQKSLLIPDGSARLLALALESKERAAVLLPSEVGACAAAASRNGKYYARVISAGRDGDQVEVDEIKDGKAVQISRMTLTGTAREVAVSDDGMTVAVAWTDGDLRIFSRSESDDRPATSTIKVTLRGLEFAAGGHAIVGIDAVDPKRLIVVDVKDGRVATNDRIAGQYRNVAISNDGRRIFAVSDFGGEEIGTELFAIDSGATKSSVLRRLAESTIKGQRAVAVGALPESEAFAVVSRSGVISIVESRRLAVRTEIRTANTSVEVHLVGRSKDSFYVVDRRRTVQLFSLDRSRAIREFGVRRGIGGGAIAVNPFADKAIVGATLGDLVEIDLSSGEQFQIATDRGAHAVVAYGVDGRRIFWASNLYVVDFEFGYVDREDRTRMVRSSAELAKAPYVVARVIDPYGQRIYYTGVDERTICSESIPNRLEPERHYTGTEPTVCLAVTRSGSLVVLEGRSVKFLDRSGSPVAEFDLGSAGYKTLTQDGTSAVVAPDDSVIVLYGLSLGSRILKLDVKTGRITSTSISDSFSPSIAFSNDSRRLAVLARQSLAIVDVATLDVLRVVESIGVFSVVRFDRTDRRILLSAGNGQLSVLDSAPPAQRPVREADAAGRPVPPRSVDVKARMIEYFEQGATFARPAGIDIRFGESPWLPREIYAALESMIDDCVLFDSGEPHADLLRGLLRLRKGDHAAVRKILAGQNYLGEMLGNGDAISYYSELLERGEVTDLDRSRAENIEAGLRTYQSDRTSYHREFATLCRLGTPGLAAYAWLDDEWKAGRFNLLDDFDGVATRAPANLREPVQALLSAVELDARTLRFLAYIEATTSEPADASKRRVLGLLDRADAAVDPVAANRLTSAVVRAVFFLRENHAESALDAIGYMRETPEFRDIASRPLVGAVAILALAKCGRIEDAGRLYDEWIVLSPSDADDPGFIRYLRSEIKAALRL